MNDTMHRITQAATLALATFLALHLKDTAAATVIAAHVIAIIGSLVAFAASHYFHINLSDVVDGDPAPTNPPTNPPAPSATTKSPVILLLLSASLMLGLSGCAGSTPAAQVYAARQTYNSTLGIWTDAISAGVVPVADIDRVEPIRSAADKTLTNLEAQAQGNQTIDLTVLNSVNALLNSFVSEAAVAKAAKNAKAATPTKAQTTQTSLGERYGPRGSYCDHRCGDRRWDSIDHAGQPAPHDAGGGQFADAGRLGGARPGDLQRQLRLPGGRRCGQGVTLIAA